jgi:hypothetical protein
MPKTHVVVGHCNRFIWPLVAVIAVSCAGGCSIFQGINDYLTYNDCVNDFVLGYRNTVWARQAWHERKSQHYGEPYFSHFGAGFRAGYADVASGGNGCPPALPPRDYWTWKYQTPEGQGMVAAWFAGYPFGAKAAEEDGAGLYQQIQVSHYIERQYSPEFPYSMGTQDDPPVTTTPTPPAATERMPAPQPGTEPPPLLDAQSRLNNGYPGAVLQPLPHVLPVPQPMGVAPAAYYEPAKRPAAASIPASMPIRTPAASPMAEFPVTSWPPSR